MYYDCWLLQLDSWSYKTADEGVKLKLQFRSFGRRRVLSLLGRRISLFTEGAKMHFFYSYRYLYLRGIYGTLSSISADPRKLIVAPDVLVSVLDD